MPSHHAQDDELENTNPLVPPAWHKILRVNLSAKNLHSVPQLEPLLGLKQLDLSCNQISKIEGCSKCTCLLAE